MRRMEDKGKTITNSIPIIAAYVVFVGYKSTIYTTSKKMLEQIFRFNGAFCRQYYSLEDAILAWEKSYQSSYMVEEIRGV